MTLGLATNPKEPLLQPAARQIGIELPLDVVRQRPALQIGSLRAEIPVSAPAAYGTREFPLGPERQRPGSRLPGPVSSVDGKVV